MTSTIAHSMVAEDATWLVGRRATVENAAFEPPAMLNGRSAAEWKALQRKHYLRFAAATVPVLVLAAVAPYQFDAVRVLGAIAILVWLVFGTLAPAHYSAGLRRRRSEEIDAGYTTLTKDLRNLPQLNPSSGDVIRYAGADFEA